MLKAEGMADLMEIEIERTVVHPGSVPVQQFNRYVDAGGNNEPVADRATGIGRQIRRVLNVIERDVGAIIVNNLEPDTAHVGPGPAPSVQVAGLLRSRQ